MPKECLHLTERGSLVSRLPTASAFRSQFSRFVSQKVREGESEREKIIRMSEAARQRGSEKTTGKEISRTLM